MIICSLFDLDHGAVIFGLGFTFKCIHETLLLDSLLRFYMEDEIVVTLLHGKFCKGTDILALSFWMWEFNRNIFRLRPVQFAQLVRLNDEIVILINNHIPKQILFILGENVFRSWDTLEILLSSIKISINLLRHTLRRLGASS